MDAVERPGTTGQGFPDQVPGSADFLAGEIGGEHVARALDEVMRFVDEKGDRVARILEMSAEISLWIKDVVVVADHGVHPHRDVEG